MDDNIWHVIKQLCKHENDDEIGKVFKHILDNWDNDEFRNKLLDFLNIGL